MNDIVKSICQAVDYDRTRLLDILIRVQTALHGIEPEVLEQISHELGISRVDVEGVVSFYSFLSLKKSAKTMIRLCDDIIDQHAGMERIKEVFSEEFGIALGETTSDDSIGLVSTPFIGMSDQAPAAMIGTQIVTRLTVESARDIAKQLKKGVLPTELDLPSGDGNNCNPLISSMVQNNIRMPGDILLTDIQPDIGLQKVLNLPRTQIIPEIEASGLTGRGGAGFPTGKKMSFAASVNSSEHYVICNADEGEPGTFKDRVLLTERADLMVEGMIIAARALGSRQGIIYLRAEYTYLLEYLESVLSRRREACLLGKAIGGVVGFDFDIRIQLGAGAYICGEESALISSCEGIRGEPKSRPPFPAESGYLGYPTVVDNVESFCCIARILAEGAQWFRSFGTAKSSGTKLFSVSGDCEKPGVYELPFGVSVRELLRYSGAEQSAMVIVGGPSGQMIDQSQFDRLLCNEDLPTGGSVMVFGRHRNILAIVDYYIDFFVRESCGYCTPCRVGNVFMKKRLEKIRAGFCQQADLIYLQQLGETIVHTSRCGLGNTSPNPILSSMKHFPLVYSVLLKEHKDRQQASFDIQGALTESRKLAKRRSMIYDPVYGDN